MKKLVLIAAVLLGGGMLSACHAEGTVYRPLQEDLAEFYKQGYGAKDVKLSFADSWEDAQTVDGQNLGTFVSNKKSNAYLHRSKKACRRAFFSALISLQHRARELGADSVENIHSYYKKIATYEPDTYRCEDGLWMAGVALRGTMVKK